ncbi:MAG: DUF1217 domain-containing protein [Rhizobiaceae bacterium]|nr:DUF1217 domain-containing protein [Rhizobiaceae bacterium]
MTAVTTFRIYASDRARTLENIAQRPQIEREVDYYKENIGDIKSIDEFMDDYRLYSFAMKAHGLEDMTYAKAFMRKILEGGTGDDGFAHDLTDQRYGQFVEDFNFEQFEAATTSFEAVTVGVVDKYYQQSIEVEAGEQSNGARLALYFQRKAADIEETLSLLADPAFLQVTQIALGLPKTMSSAPIDNQVAMIEKRLDVEDFKDPDFLDKFMQRFTILYDLNNPEVSATPSILPIGNTFAAFSDDLLTSMQNLRFNT